MPSTWETMAPGMRAARTASYRTIFLQRSESFLAQGRIIDGTLARDTGNSDPTVLRAGLVMGKVTTGGKYTNWMIGAVQTAYTSGGTTLALTPAQAAEFLRRLGASGTATAKVIGPPSAAGTVAATSMTWSAVDVTTGNITITSLGVNKIAGSIVTAFDGSEVPLTFIPDWDYGVKTTDQDGNGVASVEFPHLPVSGVVNAPQLLPWPSDTSIQAYIKNNLSTAQGGKFTFSDGY